MNKSAWILLITCLCEIVSVDAVAVVDYVNNDAENFLVFNDTVIADNAHVENITVVNSAVITNNGSIYGNIDVCDGCEVYIRNTGDINAGFNSGVYSELTQLIRTNDDLNPIGTDDFDLLVKDADNISWFGVQNISLDADRIILENSSLVFDGRMPRVDSMTAPDIELRGDVVIRLYEDYSFNGNPILSNVYGDGVVRIETESNNPLYHFVSYVSDNSLFVDVVRDTDYIKILQNDSGAFLNELRERDPDNKLIHALDSANDITEMNKIMDSSIRMKPLKLAMPVRYINSFEMATNLEFKNKISLSPLFLYSKNFNSFGINLRASYNILNNINVGASGYVALMNISDDFEEFKSSLYGGNVHIAYFNDFLFARAKFGATNAIFDIDSVLYNDKTYEEPTAFSFYSVGDFGTRFSLKDNLILSPFIRAAFDKISILDNSVDDLYAGAGTDISLLLSDYDFSYEYGLNFTAYTNGQLFAGAKIDVSSIADGAGMALNFGVLRSAEDIIGYKLDLTAKLVF